MHKRFYEKQHVYLYQIISGIFLLHETENNVAFIPGNHTFSSMFVSSLLPLCKYFRFLLIITLFTTVCALAFPEYNPKVSFPKVG